MLFPQVRIQNFNQTLSERLKRDFGIEMPNEFDSDTDIVAFIGKVRDVIRKRQGWDVVPQVHIGLFQYHKIRMYQDLHEHASLAAEHDIIKALAEDGVTIGSEPDGIPSEAELDRVVSPIDSYTVLDADASQLQAVQAVNHGAHLLIEGPPGTGKSQTIANIIAECIAAEKSVLFVSEKSAAIEVVYRRLSNQGLGEFCLMLHSQKANKRDVIYDLAAQMDLVAGGTVPTDEELRMQQLLETRNTLNAYVQALHRQRPPLGVSAFWIHGELTRLEHVPFIVAPLPPIEKLASKYWTVGKRRSRVWPDIPLLYTKELAILGTN